MHEGTPTIRILLAEDNETTASIMATFLASQGYSVTVANNGAEVLQLLPTVDPHLILMDIQMPVLDGLQATQAVRSDQRYARTPIIVLTALAMAGDRERCLAAGATDYLSKPFHLKDLTRLIQHYLQGAA